MQKEIKKNRPNNPILKTKTNKKFSKCVEGMVDSGEFMKSKNFVFNNIEHIYPSTIRKILNIKKFNKNEIRIMRPMPSKTVSMDEYDEMVIIRMLVKGTNPDIILEKFPQYSYKQIISIKNNFIRVRTEKSSSDMLGLLLDIQKQKNNWF
jgi:hypothetical protein